MDAKEREIYEKAKAAAGRDLLATRGSERVDVTQDPDGTWSFSVTKTTGGKGPARYGPSEGSGFATEAEARAAGDIAFTKRMGLRAENAEALGEPPPEAPTPPPEAPPPEAPSGRKELADVGAEGEAPATALPHKVARSRSDLPEGINFPGEHFPTELMEATRRLGATARYKHLRGAKKGQYVQYVEYQSKRDRIEMGDIENSRTMAHELGHRIDYLLEGGKAARKIPREERDELRNVSRTIRPWDPAKVTENHARYRNSSSELFADYVSMYLHDPAQARRLAPKFTERFEASIRNDADVQGVIRELHEGYVEPVVKERVVKPVEPSETTPEEMSQPAKVWEKNTQAAAKAAAKRLALEKSRTHESQLQRASQITQGWERRLSEAEREDVGAAVEGTGNIRIKGDTIQEVKARLTREQKQVLKEYRFEQERARQEVNRYLRKAGDAEYIKFLDDYLAHFYVKPGKAIRERAATYLRNSPSAKQRKIPTLQEAVEAGYVPITQDIARLHRMWASYNWRVATNRSFLHHLRKIRTTEGDRVVMPPSKAPSGYVRIDHPAVAVTYARPAGEGKVNLWSGGAAVHPDVAPYVKAALNIRSHNAIVRAVEGMNAWFKRASLSFSLFHHFALTESAQAVFGPRRGLVMLGEKDPATGKRMIATTPHKRGLRLLEVPEAREDAIQSGLKIGSLPDAQLHVINRHLTALESKTRNVPILGRITRGFRKFNEWWDKKLWDHYHNGLKMASWYDLVEQGVRGKPDATPEWIAGLKRDAAKFVNDAYGGQEWINTVMRDPKVQQALQMVMLAPDWTFSNIRIAADVRAGEAGLRRRWMARYWRNLPIALSLEAIGIQAAIYAAFGDEKKGDRAFPWQNEKGHKFDFDVTPLLRKLGIVDDKTRRYAHFGKQAREVVRWVSDPVKLMFSKSSPVVHMAAEQLTGATGEGFDAEWVGKGFWEGLPSRAKRLAETALPFSLRGNNFALTAPMSKGMTYWKAREAMVDALREYAEPSFLRRWTGTAKEYRKELGTLIEDIIDAAERNGVDKDKVFRDALGRVRGGYYSDFFKAWQAGEGDDLEEAARRVIMLHGNLGTILRSAKSRGIEIPPAEQDRLEKLMREAAGKVGAGAESAASSKPSVTKIGGTEPVSPRKQSRPRGRPLRLREERERPLKIR